MLHLPTKVSMAGKVIVYYELVVTSLSSDSVELKELQVIGKGGVIRVFNQEALTAISDPLRTNLGPGEMAILYLEVPVPNHVRAFSHSIVFKRLSKGVEVESSMSLPEVRITPAYRAIGPPLGSGNWAAIFNPEWQRGHRRVVYKIGGRPRIPGRLAIDFILLDDDGHYATGDEDVITEWHGYSADVLAVADAVVLSIRNDFPEIARISEHPVYPAEQATGNYISLELKDGRTAFYEHLKPGSVKVLPGQKVKKGDVIASLGFTGQTTGPHLHFHVTDRNSALGAEGVPFTFEEYELLGGYPDFNLFGKTRWEQLPDSKHRKMKNDVPGSNSVVRFPTSKSRR